MTQNLNSDASQEYVKFDIEDADSFSQDWFDARDDEQIVRNLPRVVAKIPNLGAKTEPKKIRKRRGVLTVLKTGGLAGIFLLGAVFGRQFNLPDAGTPSTEEGATIALVETDPVDEVKLDDLAPSFDASALSNAPSSTFDEPASDRSFQNDDALYRDLDDVSFSAPYGDATNSWQEDSFAQTTNDQFDSSAPVNPFARNFDEPASDGFDRPALDAVAFDQVGQSANAAPNQNQNQPFSNWSDLNAPVANAAPAAPQSVATPYAVANAAPEYGAQAATPSYGAAQGFGDYQPYAAPTPSYNAQYAQRPVENNAQNYGANYGANAASSANTTDYQSDYADNSKFRGFNTSGTEEKSAIQQDYAINRDNSNYNRPMNSGALANAPYNVDATNAVAPATTANPVEYLARDPESSVIDPTPQSTQPSWGAQGTPSRAPRW